MRSIKRHWTKGIKQLKNNETDIEYKTTCLSNWQTGADDAARTENIHSSATVAYQNK